MIYPDKIKIGGTALDVILQGTPIVNPENGAKLYGAALMDQRAIVLWDHPTCPDVTEETLIHECIEATIAMYDLQFEDPNTGARYVMPHSAIKTLGVALHQAFSEANLCFGTGNHTTH